MKPLCFILMPFGIKTDGNKKEIDFDKVYNDFIRQAIILAELEPIRADEEKAGGFIHKPMYERLMFCNFAVADLSFANANVFYELGIRHALKPYTTVSIFEMNTKLPFDTSALRTFPYSYENGQIADIDNKIKDLAALIKVNLNAQRMQQDSPIGQLIQSYKFPDLDYLQEDADAFADRAINTKNQKDNLNTLVNEWKVLDKTKAETDDEKNKIKADKRNVIDNILKTEQEEGNDLMYNYDLLYSFLNAYKSVSAFKEIADMLKPLAEGAFKDNIFIKQQLGLALNKIGKREDAETILKTITDKYGPDPETNGLLGAVYKGNMDDNKDDEGLAAAYRKQAADAYLEGFEADPREYYPGVNALTLMFLGDAKDDRFDKFIPLVTYATERQAKTKAKDYWVQATLLELAVLDMNEITAKNSFNAALTCKPDAWMKETTAANLVKIYNKAFALKDAQSLEWLKKDIILKLNPKAFDLK